MGMSAEVMKKILSMSVIVLFGLFLWVDKLWNEVIAKAVAERLGRYGESFGMLSFIRPTILYLTLVLTLCLIVVNFKRK